MVWQIQIVISKKMTFVGVIVGIVKTKLLLFLKSYENGSNILCKDYRNFHCMIGREKVSVVWDAETMGVTHRFYSCELSCGKDAKRL